MRLWFAHSGEVPIYRQLVTQVALAILCGDLRPGDRLPSTREIARRFALHPNTVSAGYRQLEKDGWTERRRGSGIYVRTHAEPPSTPEQMIDHHIAGSFARRVSLGCRQMRCGRGLRSGLLLLRRTILCLIDPDPELRRILLTEIRSATTWAVDEASPEDCCRPETLAAAIPLCRPSKAKLVRAASAQRGGVGDAADSFAQCMA